MKGTSRPPILRCRDVHRSLGHAENRSDILNGIDMKIEASQVCAIAGPSGCGKSTLLYLFGLLDRPDEGSIWLNECEVSTAHDVFRTRLRNEHIGFVFQFHFLLPAFTAIENVMIPMKKAGRMRHEQMQNRASALLDDIGLAGKTHRQINQLSGGEQQRVAIARALANNPSLLLADEPTGNLDFQTSETVFSQLYDLAKDRGAAVLLVTHNHELSSRCDRTFQMRDGRFMDA